MRCLCSVRRLFEPDYYRHRNDFPFRLVRMPAPVALSDHPPFTHIHTRAHIHTSGPLASLRGPVSRGQRCVHDVQWSSTVVDGSRSSERRRVGHLRCGSIRWSTCYLSRGGPECVHTPAFLVILLSATLHAFPDSPRSLSLVINFSAAVSRALVSMCECGVTAFFCAVCVSVCMCVHVCARMRVCVRG